ncbi:MAG: hypothetical protein RIC12_00080 [Pirellulales bacterium]
MDVKELPAYVSRVLSRFEGVRPTKDGWDALCPCPDHNASSGNTGDHNPSLGIKVGENGRILIVCRVGCKTAQVLEAAGLGWGDLFAPADVETTTAAASDTAQPTFCEIEVSHVAYTRLLDELALSESHLGQLRQRGLSEDAIQSGQYRSLRNVDRGSVAKRVHAELGAGVLTVPGFSENEYGVTLAGTSTGLLIPVRDLVGRIQAIKIRRATDPKYVYLTSRDDGRSSGSPVHVPLGISSPRDTVRVTEGELKADVCTLLGQQIPTISAPGVTQWKAVLPVLRELKAETVIIAFDAPDLHTKPPVFQQACNFYRRLKADGYQVEMEDWHDTL